MGLSVSITGSIIGSPDTQTFSSSSVTIIATDEDGNTASTSLTFPQVDSGAAGGGGNQYGPIWSTYVYGPATLKVNVEMADMFLDVTGTGPVSFTISNLPSGLYVDGSYIKGTPSASAQNDFTTSVMIMATDDNGSQTKYVTFPSVANAAPSGPTWASITEPGSLIIDAGMSLNLSDFITGDGSISYTVTGLPSGLDENAGTISGSPSTFSGDTTTVSITATDDNGSSSTTVTFPSVANAAPSGPTWASITEPGSLIIDAGMSLNLSDFITGDGSISYTVTGLPSGLDENAGTISGSPSTFSGDTTTVSITATDDNGSSSTTVTFPSVANAAPSGPTWASITEPGSLIIDAGMSLNLSDFITGDGSISYTVTGLPSGLDENAGTISGSPSTFSGDTTTVSITATDDNGSSSTTVTFPSVANAAPSGPTWASITEPGSLIIDAGMSLNLSDFITGDGSISYTVTGLPSGLDENAGTISGSPSTFSGDTTTVSITATDDNGSSSTTVTFPSVANAAPSGPTWASITEPGSLIIDAGMSLNLSDFITGDGSISYTVTGLPSGLDENAGTISGSPSTFSGDTTTVSITATDDNGSSSTTVTFPSVASGAETVDFTTAVALPSASASDEINQQIVATGSQGSTPTYTFVSASNTGNAFGLSGTTITVTGNQISGIAPRLLNAATYSFEIQASIKLVQ